MTQVIVDATTDAELDVVFADLVTTYAADAIICPQLNPLPHPSRAALGRHVAEGDRILTLHADGVMINTQLVVKGAIHACWGPVDRVAMQEAQLGVDGFAAFYEAEGPGWRLDTHTEGVVASDYFRDYALQGRGSPFDVTVTTHPGLGGLPITAYDEQRWALVINRPDDTSPWEWHYEVAGS